jgi:hypothetical protein
MEVRKTSAHILVIDKFCLCGISRTKKEIFNEMSVNLIYTKKSYHDGDDNGEKYFVNAIRE